MTTLGLLWLLRLLALEPVQASIAGARLAGFPGLASELLDICEAETRCSAIGIHHGKAERVSGAVFWRAAVEAGWLVGCDAHALQRSDRWGIRGTHGLAAAYSVRWLGECVDPAAIDVPLLSALVTARRLGELSQRYKLRTIDARAHAWRHGVGCRCEAGRGLARCALCPPRDDAE